MTQKLGDLINAFKKTYALGNGEIDHVRHDAVHVMAGFGLGVAEELRVAALEGHLRRSYWNDHESDPPPIIRSRFRLVVSQNHGGDEGGTAWQGRDAAQNKLFGC